MNVLAIMPWYPATASRFFADAFEQLGHRVFRYGPMYFDHYGLAYRKSDLPIVDAPVPRGSTWVLDDIIDTATRRDFVPDLIFLSEEDYQNQIVPTSKVPVVLWSADGWPNCFARRHMIQPTIAYTQHPLGVIPHPLTEIPDGWKFLPGGFDRRRHRREKTVCDFDFCLLATMYGSREKLCRGLRDRGFRVASGQAELATYRKLYNSSLCTYHNCNGQVEIKWRFFEAAVMGCVNICDENFLLGALGFVPDIHYFPIWWDCETNFDPDHWPTVDGLTRAVCALRNEPDKARSIATAAMERVLNGHCYTDRVARILLDLGMVSAKELERVPEDLDLRFRNYCK